MAIIFAIAYAISQGWNFYQNRLKTEKKIHKMQSIIKKKAKEHADQKKHSQDLEIRTKEKISKQIAAATQREPNSPGELSKRDKDIDKKNGFEQAGQVMMQRTKSHVNTTHEPFFRDDLSIGKKSANLEDPMVAQAKDRELKYGSKHPITRICLTGGPCAGKTTALATLSLHLK